MDLWVVAAAAGAGYLAKYWQKFSRDREDSLGFPSQSPFHDNLESPSFIQHTDKTCAVHKLSPRETSEQYLIENSHESGTIPSPSIFPPEYGKYDDFEEYRSDNVLDYNIGDVPESNTSKVWALHGSVKRKNSLRSKRLHLQYIKPRSSPDSCLITQMHMERAEMEEYLLSPLVSPCTPTLRPFLVTDGRQVISRASGDLSDGLHLEARRKANDGAVGVPALPQIGKAKMEKIDRGKNQMGKASNSSSSMHFDSQGSSSWPVLFWLGISTGIITTIIASKLEVEKLRVSLKRSENLVQDLQEELEMKDSLTVKELVYDDDSLDAHEHSCGDKRLNMFSEQVNANVVVKYADEESVTLKETESISKIEAELEAELEILELSMKETTLQGGLLDAIEFDQEIGDDLMAELVHGELKADIIPTKSSSEPTPDQVSSSSSTPFSAKEGVSPRELSLRLHEVIQSRLQQRIIELEAELAKNQKRVQDLESEKKNSWREMSSSDSSTLGSPIAHSPMAHPLIMNLSGDALDAYNEAYEELGKLKGSRNEASQVATKSPQDNLLPGNQIMFDRQSGAQDCTRRCLFVTDVEPLSNGRKKIPFVEGSLKSCEDKDGNDDDDDLLLIKQIVEKARQGSPALLRAQKAMVYVDQEER